MVGAALSSQRCTSQCHHHHHHHHHHCRFHLTFPDAVLVPSCIWLHSGSGSGATPPPSRHEIPVFGATDSGIERLDPELPLQNLRKGPQLMVLQGSGGISHFMIDPAPYCKHGVTVLHVLTLRGWLETVYIATPVSTRFLRCFAVEHEVPAFTGMLDWFRFTVFSVKTRAMTSQTACARWRKDGAGAYLGAPQRRSSPADKNAKLLLYQLCCTPRSFVHHVATDICKTSCWLIGKEPFIVNVWPIAPASLSAKEIQL